MSQHLSDEQLINELESRPDLMMQYLADREEQMKAELMETNKKLVEAEQIKTDFLSNIRNEMINPITAMLELSKNLATNAVQHPEKLAALIYEETYKLDFQLKNILGSAEIEAGEAVLSVSAVDIDGLLSLLLERFDRQILKKKLKVELLGALPDAFRFHTDSEKLTLVLSNLLANAIQYSPENGCIEIAYCCYDNVLQISFADQGIGISSENQRAIFSRFTQLDRGTTKAYAGHGLGLSLVQALLDFMEGSLTLESSPGQGSTFTVQLQPLQPGDDSFTAMGNEFFFDNDSVF